MLTKLLIFSVLISLSFEWEIIPPGTPLIHDDWTGGVDPTFNSAAYDSMTDTAYWGGGGRVYKIVDYSTQTVPYAITGTFLADRDTDFLVWDFRDDDTGSNNADRNQVGDIELDIDGRIGFFSAHNSIFIFDLDDDTFSVTKIGTVISGDSVRFLDYDPVLKSLYVVSIDNNNIDSRFDDRGINTYVKKFISTDGIWTGTTTLPVLFPFTITDTYIDHAERILYYVTPIDGIYKINLDSNVMTVNYFNSIRSSLNFGWDIISINGYYKNLIHYVYLGYDFGNLQLIFETIATSNSIKVNRLIVIPTQADRIYIDTFHEVLFAISSADRVGYRIDILNLDIRSVSFENDPNLDAVLLIPEFNVFVIGERQGNSDLKFWIITLAECEQFSCLDCLRTDKIYCGYCSETLTSSPDCTTELQCPYDFVLDFSCPAYVSIDPTTGPITGGTVVTVRGAQGFSGIVLCRWNGDTSEVPFTSPRTENGKYFVECQAPPAADLGKGDGDSITIEITEDGVGYAENIKYFKYHDCSAATTCAACGQLNDCGWCVTSDSCTSNSECSDGVDYWLENKFCPSGEITPSSLNYLGEDISIEFEHNINTTSFRYFCAFIPLNSTYGVEATIISQTTITCSAPPGDHGYTIEIEVYIIHIDSFISDEINTMSLFSVGSLNILRYYDCLQTGACAICNDQPLCLFEDTLVCEYLADSVGTPLSICPSLTYIFPLSDLLTGGQLLNATLSDFPAGTIYECVWTLGGDVQKSPAIVNNGVDLSCTIPSVLTASVDWIFSIQLDSKSIVEGIEFEFYDCANLETCYDCESEFYSRCQYCDDTCKESSTCIITNQTFCPELSNNIFNKTIFGGFLVMDGASLDLEPSTHFCVVDGSKYSVNESSTSFIICEIPPSVEGSYDLYISDNSDRRITNIVPFNIYDCPSTTNCADCVSPTYPECTYCKFSCRFNLDDACEDITDVCPLLQTVTPSRLLQFLDQYFVIFGTYFEPLTGSSYRCQFISWSNSSITSRTTAYDEGATSLKCPVPLDVPPGNYYIEIYSSVLSVVQLYAEKSDYLNVTIFQCPTLVNGCVDCYTEPECAFCPHTQECSTQCATLSNDFTILPACPNVIYTTPSALPLISSTEIRLTIDSNLFDSRFFDRTLFSCQWNDVKTPATLYSVSEVICISPGGTDNQETSVNIHYRDIPITNVSGQVLFKDCKARDCQECSVDDACGWCLWQNECTVQQNCVNDLPWIMNGCPSINAFITTTNSRPEGNIWTTLKGQYFIDHPDMKITFGPYTSKHFRYQDSETVHVLVPNSEGEASLDVEMQINGRTYAAFAVTDTQWIYEINTDNADVGLIIFLIILLIVILGLIVGFLIWFKLRETNHGFNFEPDMTEPNYPELLYLPSSLEVPVIFPSDNFVDFERMLFGDGEQTVYKIFTEALDASDQDKAAKSIIYITEANDITLEFLQTTIVTEIRGCKHANTIFRGNSLASKMFTVYAKLIALPYLFHTIGYFIRQIDTLARRKEDDQGTELGLMQVDLEVDEERLDEKSLGGLEENKMQLTFIISKILRAIYDSLDDIPTGIRVLFGVISEAISENFGDEDPNIHYWAIGGLFFLRFLVPSIFFPSNYGLLTELPVDEAKRQLILISKIVQSIGNIAVPGKKEAFLQFMKGFIEEQIPITCNFYDKLMDFQGLSDDEPVEIPGVVLANARNDLFSLFKRRSAKILQTLEAEGHHEEIEQVEQILAQYQDESQYTKPKVKQIRASMVI